MPSLCTGNQFPGVNSDESVVQPQPHCGYPEDSGPFEIIGERTSRNKGFCVPKIDTVLLVENLKRRDDRKGKQE